MAWLTDKRHLVLFPARTRSVNQRSSPSQISSTLWAGFELTSNLSSGLVEWSSAVMITTTSGCHGTDDTSADYQRSSFKVSNEKKKLDSCAFLSFPFLENSLKFLWNSCEIHMKFKYVTQNPEKLLSWFDVPWCSWKFERGCSI